MSGVIDLDRLAVALGCTVRDVRRARDTSGAAHNYAVIADAVRPYGHATLRLTTRMVVPYGTAVAWQLRLEVPKVGPAYLHAVELDGLIFVEAPHAATRGVGELVDAIALARVVWGGTVLR